LLDTIGQHGLVGEYGIQNPKFEFRNPKQCPKSQSQMTQTRQCKDGRCPPDDEQEKIMMGGHDPASMEFMCGLAWGGGMYAWVHQSKLEEE